MTAAEVEAATRIRHFAFAVEHHRDREMPLLCWNGKARRQALLRPGSFRAA